MNHAQRVHSWIPQPQTQPSSASKKLEPVHSSNAFEQYKNGYSPSFLTAKGLLNINKVKAMSRVKTNRSVEELESLLENTSALMENHKTKGNYSEAENCRIAIEQMRIEREARRIKGMERRHHEEKDELMHQAECETRQLFQYWQARLKEQANEGEIATMEMETRHSIEQDRTREELELESPLKVKESVQCLNLRKMEAYMVKQKNYAQAHLVQKQIANMQKAEKGKWMGNRTFKIQAALRHLREKQENELANLAKNIKATAGESRKQRQRDEERLALKYANLERELTMKQEKEKIAHRGEFTSKGGEGSPLLTKSRLLKSRQ